MRFFFAIALSLLVVFPAVAGVTPEQLQKLYASPSPFDAVPKSEWVAESRHAFVIHAKNPQAPVHLLIIPKYRVPTLLEASPSLIAEMVTLAKRVAREQGIAQDGFRLIINTRPYGGQSVYQLHMHLLGGKELGWVPGFREQ